MFIPSVHAETSIPVLRNVIRQNPLGVITTAIPSQGHPLILSSHIPFVLDVNDESSETELGRLRGHLARQNPQSKAMIGSLDANATDVGTLEQEVLVLFTTTSHHYVTPKFYRETKPITGKVVPTWNYTAVEAYGSATLYFGSSSKVAGDFLGQQIHDLSQHAEATVMDYTGQGDRPGPWKVTDAPDRYIELMKKNIIGIEISITRLEGKFKMSQEMRKGDREGVIEGFGRMGTALGDAIAATVRQRGDLKQGAKN